MEYRAICLEDVKTEKFGQREILYLLLDSEANEKKLVEEVRLAGENVEKFNAVKLTVHSRLTMPSSPESCNGMNKSNPVRLKLHCSTLCNI